MSDTINTYNPRRPAWYVTWNSFELGQSGEVDPTSWKMSKTAITRGTTGKVVLGHFFDGAEGEIKAQVKDLNVTAFVALCPWMTVSTNQILVPSTMNVNMYSFAQKLTLHPMDKGDATEDLIFPKAVPSVPVNAKRDGQKDDLWEIMFTIYPDLSQLQTATPKLVYGWVGSSTPSDE